MKYYEIDEIYPWLYRIKEPLNVCFYLAVGREKALLFDTGHGIGNIPEIIRSIMSKTVVAVLGHAHVDHANGAFQFDEVYLHENDFALFEEHTSSAFRKVIIKNLEESGKIPCDYFNPKEFISVNKIKINKLEYDTVFDLGGLNLRVINMAGHTKGSIGLLVLEHKTLLTSDSANDHVWLFGHEATSINEYVNMLERVLQVDFNCFFTAHSNKSYPKSDFQNYIRVAREATIEKAVPYNIFTEFKPYIYENYDAAIVFNSKKL